MKIGPMFKWFGSKWSGAKHYPAPIGDTIVEPFAGGAGYALNHCDRNVIIWDDDPNVNELWQWLIGPAKSKDIQAIPCGLPIGTDIRTVGLSRGQALLLKHWQRTNNVGDCWTTSPWGHLPGQWTKNTRARVAEEISAVKHWRVKTVGCEIDQPGVTWLIDPPYQFNYRYSQALPEFDYRALVSMVETIHPESLVVVCEALGKHGERPNYLPFVESHRQVTSRRKTTESHHSRELIYVRQPRLGRKAVAK